MVAVTPNFDLPYQEGSDPPCFGPGAGCDNLTSVWCDFAQLVEGQLDAIDSIIGRTTAAIPMAKVSMTGPTDSDTGTSVVTIFPFDTVEFDTDNMTDLNTAPGIRPNRNGIYRIDFRCFFTSDGDGLRRVAHVAVGTEQEPFSLAMSTIPSLVTALTLSSANSTQDIFASGLWLFDDTTPAPRTVIVDALGEPIRVLYAALQLTWHSEVS